MNESIINALNWRYAVKEFDPSKMVSDADLKTILESGRLAPSSFGIEPSKFLVIKNEEARVELRKASYGQSKVTDASHLVVIARRTDAGALADELLDRVSKAHGTPLTELEGLRQMISGVLSAPAEAYAAWSAKQTYIALGIMMETAALLHVDSCPMEGFDSKSVDEILGLSEKNLASVSLLALGYRGNDPAASQKKVRRGFDEVVEFIR